MNMNRFLIFVASLFFAFVAISSAATANPLDWTRASNGTFAPESGLLRGASGVASWATVPAPRIFDFVTIRL
jgi:hypothetical protein